MSLSLKRVWKSMNESKASQASDRVNCISDGLKKLGIGYSVTEDRGVVVIDTDVPAAIIQYTNPRSNHPDEVKTKGSGHVVIRVDGSKISAEGDGYLAAMTGYEYGYGIGGNGAIVNGNGQYGYKVGNGVGVFPVSEETAKLETVSSYSKNGGIEEVLQFVKKKADESGRTFIASSNSSGNSAASSSPSSPSVQDLDKMYRGLPAEYRNRYR